MSYLLIGRARSLRVSSVVSTALRRDSIGTRKPLKLSYSTAHPAATVGNSSRRCISRSVSTSLPHIRLLQQRSVSRRLFSSGPGTPPGATTTTATTSTTTATTSTSTSTTSTTAAASSARASSSSASSTAAASAESSTQTAYYLAAVAVAVFGLAYAAVPLYKVFCQMTGFGGTTRRADAKQAILVKPVDGGRIIRVEFVGAVHSAMPWSFRPTQHAVKVVPGETALAFFTASNRASYPITGVATYNVQPPRAGLYFNKIQCFCFEEQRLGGNEEIDMPVFFYIDPAYADDPFMANIENIVLSYTFFKTGEELPADPKTAVIQPARRGFSSARSISDGSSNGSTASGGSGTSSSVSSSHVSNSAGGITPSPTAAQN